MVVRKNFRVVAYPDIWQGHTENTSENTYMSTCEDIVKSIKRHVDDIESIRIEWDTTYLCTLCGREWDNYENGLPSCCDEAQDIFYAENPHIKREES